MRPRIRSALRTSAMRHDARSPATAVAVLVPLEAAELLEDLGGDLLGGGLLQVVRAFDHGLPGVWGEPQPVALILLASGVGLGGTDNEDGKIADGHGQCVQFLGVVDV